MSNSSEAINDRGSAMRRVAILALLYLIAPVQSLLPVTDPDIWWHLRVGEWIVDHRVVPYQDYFSAYGAGKTWIAYSWLFEVLVYVVHESFGLVGIVGFNVVMAILITGAVHALVRRGRLPFVTEVLLTALTVATMKPLMSPRPWLFTILFFALQLLLVTRAREEGNARRLWLLPLIFILWANVHVQFIYGLAVLGLLVLESMALAGLGRLGFHSATPVPLRALLPIAAASCLAALATPYGFLLFRPIGEYMAQTGAFQNIAEFHPMFFRSIEDWIVLVLMLAAVFALGWQRKWPPFPILLILLGVALGFRARRDTWLLVLAATWIISNHLSHRLGAGSFIVSRGRALAAGMGVLLGIYAIGLQRGINERNLQEAVAAVFPAAAVEYIRQQRLSGPILNTLDWGGFLIWKLREIPVAMDGRTNLYGDRRVAMSVAFWSAHPGWDSYPELKTARLIMADHGRPLIWLLRRDPNYEVVYEDRAAVILVPKGLAGDFGAGQAGGDAKRESLKALLAVDSLNPAMRFSPVRGLAR